MIKSIDLQDVPPKEDKQYGEFRREPMVFVNEGVWKKAITAPQLGCGDCIFREHCRMRVSIGLFLACERPTERDRRMVENSQNREAMIELLEAVYFD